MSKKKKLNHATLRAHKDFGKKYAELRELYKNTFNYAAEALDPVHGADKAHARFVTGHYVTSRTAGGYYSMLWSYWFMRRALYLHEVINVRPSDEFKFLKDMFALADGATREIRKEDKRKGFITYKPEKKTAEAVADQEIFKLERKEGSPEPLAA